MRRLLRDDRGGAGLELAILAPVFFLLIILVVVSDRTSTAANLVASAAHDSARAASLARSAPASRAAADRTANAVLAGHGYTCTDRTVTTDTSGFNVPLGQPGAVTVTVSCRVAYSDLLKFPGIPGSKVISDSFTSPLDTYRQR